jgi:hypothetical protein
MSRDQPRFRFEAKLLRPVNAGKPCSWAFLILPKSISEMLPRRGRTNVDSCINGRTFQATLNPDGQLGHWFKISDDLCNACGVKAGDTVRLEMSPVATEPEPELPDDFAEALAASAEATRVWDTTTTIARIDWIHWIESAKQSKTRRRRIENACDMLASGKGRVCCFDPSGFYSKAFSAPKAAE